MGLNGLNSQRKKYHYIPIGTCNTCNAKSETPAHYLLHLPTYAVQRQQMLHELSQSVPDVIQHFINFQNDRRRCTDFVQILLNGTGKLESDTHIFKTVNSFIEKTNRFT